MSTSQANRPDRESPDAGPPGGLLEQALLRIAPPDAAGRRAVRDASGGLIGLCQPLRLPWWRRWLGPGFAAFEAHDLPLVFSVLPSLALGPCLVVHDAEGELIGTATRRRVYDCWGRPLLHIRSGGGGGQFEAPGGPAVARWAVQAGEATLVMDRDWLPGPFERMLVLAATLGAHWRAAAPQR